MPMTMTPPAVMTVVAVMAPPMNLIDDRRRLSHWSELGYCARDGGSLRGTNRGKAGKSANCRR
jgi:putative hemolysin